MTRVRRQAWVIFGAVVVWGAAITAFGFSTVLWLSLRPPGRGRLGRRHLGRPAQHRPRCPRSPSSSAAGWRPSRWPWSRAVRAWATSSPALVATAVTTEFSIVSGGLACIVGAVALMAALPGFRRYRDDPDAPPAG